MRDFYPKNWKPSGLLVYLAKFSQKVWGSYLQEAFLLEL